MNNRAIRIARSLCLLTALVPALSLGEPRILIGPTEPEEEPEVVDTISGLSYDQLKRLRELRKWLEERQMIREQRQLGHRSLRPNGELFSDRELLSPLGQRYSDRLPAFSARSGGGLTLPPLPHFDTRDDDVGASRAELPFTPLPDPAGAATTPTAPTQPATSPEGRRITHIFMPTPAGQDDAPQIEYELNHTDAPSTGHD